MTRILSDSFAPAPGIPLGMKDGHDHDLSVVLHKEHSIREPAGERPPDGSMDTGKLPRVPENRAENGVNATQEFQPQTGNAVFVLAERIGQLRFGLGADDEPAAHRRLRMRFRTLSQGDPSPGLRWYASSRRSSSAFWVSVKRTSSGVSAMLSQMSSTSSMLSGTLRLSTPALVNALMMLPGNYNRHTPAWQYLRRGGVS